jgi:hypothetical protein
MEKLTLEEASEILMRLLPNASDKDRKIIEQYIIERLDPENLKAVAKNLHQNLRGIRSL